MKVNDGLSVGVVSSGKMALSKLDDTSKLIRLAKSVNPYLRSDILLRDTSRKASSRRGM